MCCRSATDHRPYSAKGFVALRRLAALVVALMAVVLLASCDTDTTIIVRDEGLRYGCLTFSDVGSGPVQETWQCFDRFDRAQVRPLVTLTRLGDVSDGYGEVTVADETHPARFRIAGLDWRWDFGCDERDPAYPYAFVIEPDGSGLYYDFTASTDGTARPSDFFDCLLAP